MQVVAVARATLAPWEWPCSSPAQFPRPSSPSPPPFHHGPGRQLLSVLPSPDCPMLSLPHCRPPAAEKCGVGDNVSQSTKVCLLPGGWKNPCLRPGWQAGWAAGLGVAGRILLYGSMPYDLLMTISGAAAPSWGLVLASAAGHGLRGSPDDPPQPLGPRDWCWDLMLTPQPMAVNLLCAMASEG